MKKAFFKITLLSTALALAGCGGGDGGGNLSLFPANLSIDAGSSLSLPAGQTFALNGIARSQNTIITSMNWQILRNSSGVDFSAQAVVSNKDCDIMGAAQSGDYKSIRTCSAQVTLPSGAAGQTYTMILSATDDKGNAKSGSTTINVAASNNALIINAGEKVVSQFGQVVDAQCVANGGYVYAGSSPIFEFFWKDSKGQPIQLSPAVTSYVSRNDGIMINAIGSTQFKAPINSDDKDQTLLLGCRVTDSRGSQSEALKTIILQKSPPVQANAGPVQIAKPNDLVVLDAGGSVDPLAGLNEGGGASVLYYFWVQNRKQPIVPGYTTPPPNLSLTSANSPNPTFIAPNVILTNGSRNVYAFDLYVDRKSIDINNLEKYKGTPSHAETRVLVDSSTPLLVSVDSPKKGNAGEAVTMSSSLSTPPSTGQQVYYRWKQVGGTPVNLSNSTASSAGFMIPTNLVRPEVLTFELVVALQNIDDNVAQMAAPGEKVLYYVYLNDFERLSVSVNSPQNVTPGAPIILRATVPSTGYPVYYRWSQTFGVPVVITGRFTEAAQAVIPSNVIVGSTFTFRVDVSSVPFVSESMPNAPVVSADVQVVTVATPAP